MAANYLPYKKTWFNAPLRAGVLVNRKLDVFVAGWTPTILADGKSLYTRANAVHAGLNFFFR